MRPLVLIVLLGVTLSASAAPAPLPRRERGEKPSLEGEWLAVEERGGGGPGRRPRPALRTPILRGTLSRRPGAAITQSPPRTAIRFVEVGG